MRLRIAVDCDDVLLDSNASLIPFHNARYGTSCGVHDKRSWHLEEPWRCTVEEAHARVEEWYHSPDHARILPVVGAVQGVTELARKYDLYVVSSRPERVSVLTNTLLDKYFPGCFQGCHFTSTTLSGTGLKVDCCKALGVSLLIDDSLGHALPVAASGIPVLLLDCPWNQGAVEANITRVFSWEEAVATAASILGPAK